MGLLPAFFAAFGAAPGVLPLPTGAITGGLITAPTGTPLAPPAIPLEDEPEPDATGCWGVALTVPFVRGASTSPIC